MKNKTLKLIITGLIAVAMTVSLTGCKYVSHGLKFGTSCHGGTYIQVADKLGSILNNKDAALQVETRKTQGSVSNIRLINENRIQLALVQADIVDDAYHAKGIFKGEDPLTNYRAIASLYTEKVQIVVRRGSSINSIRDLKGKTVNIGELKSGTLQNAKEVLAAYNLSFKNVKFQHQDFNLALQALKDKKVDAVFLTAGQNTKAITEAADQMHIRLLSIDARHQKRILAANPDLRAAVIPAKTYDGQNAPVTTVGVRCILLVKRTLPDAAVQDICENMFTYRTHLQKAVTTPLDLSVKHAVKGVPVPFHKGAAKYYEDKGITVRTK